MDWIFRPNLTVCQLWSFLSHSFRVCQNDVEKLRKHLRHWRRPENHSKEEKICIRDSVRQPTKSLATVLCIWEHYFIPFCLYIFILLIECHFVWLYCYMTLNTGSSLNSFCHMSILCNNISVYVWYIHVQNWIVSCMHFWTFGIKPS